MVIFDELESELEFAILISFTLLNIGFAVRLLKHTRKMLCIYRQTHFM